MFIIRKILCKLFGHSFVYYNNEHRSNEVNNNPVVYKWKCQRCGKVTENEYEVFFG